MELPNLDHLEYYDQDLEQERTDDGQDVQIEEAEASSYGGGGGGGGGAEEWRHPSPLQPPPALADFLAPMESLEDALERLGAAVNSGRPNSSGGRRGRGARADEMFRLMDVSSFVTCSFIRSLARSLVVCRSC